MAARCWPRRVVDLSAALNALEFIVKIRGVERSLDVKKNDQSPLSRERDVESERQVLRGTSGTSQATTSRRRLREQQVRMHSFNSTTLAPTLKKTSTD